MEIYNNLSDKELIRRWGEKLKEMRIESGLSQNDVAEQTGMSRSSIAGIENGRNFSIASLISILRTFTQLDKVNFFLKEKEYELTPMEIYKREKKKKKRAGYNRK